VSFDDVVVVDELLDEKSDGAAAHLHAAREVGAGNRLMAANEGQGDLAVDVPRGSASGDVEAIGVYAAHLHQPGANLELRAAKTPR
jgi:hypothetical protein